MTFPDITISKVRQAATLIVLASFVLTNTVAAAATSGGTKTTVAGTSALGKFTTDLTQLGHEGRLRQNLNFESETAQLIRVLGKSGIQPVIVNDSRETQDTIVEQLALRIAKGSVPGTLSGKTILKLETEVLFSNVRSEAEAAAAIDAIIDEVVATNGRTILFIGELAAVADAGTHLLRGLTNGKLSIIGASSVASYQELRTRSDVVNFLVPITVGSKAPTTATTQADPQRTDG